VIGKTPGAVLDGAETDTKTLEYIWERQRKKEPYRVEILNYKKNGEPYWAEVQGQPLFDNEGNIQQFFSIETDITERKNLEKQLEMQRKKLTADVISAQEKERSQIGLELHDNVNQVLTTVKLYTELCRDGIGNTSEILDKSTKLLQESINEIRSLSKRLSAPSLGNIKLKDSIKELVDSVSATDKIYISFDGCKIQDLEVSKDLHMTIYRILQEHFTNILRHSKASKVKVALKLEKANLVLQVKDNGKGFDPCQKFAGIGITNMVTRAESIKGNLSINSAPGKGCKLLARFPLD
jgi:signal transduction histidine kinase